MSAADGLQLCPCGCGGLPKTPGCEFLPGHHARVAERTPRGHLRPRCASGGQKYCARCDAPLRPGQGATRQGRFCSTRCARIVERRLTRPEAEFNRFIYDRLLMSKTTINEFAKQIGLPRTTLRNILGGMCPTRPNLEKLQAFFGPALPVITSETERRRERANRMRERLPLPGTPKWQESRRRSGVSLRGRRQAPELVQKRMDARRASGGEVRAIELLRTQGQQPKARLLARLGSHLRSVPSPTIELIRQWAERDAGLEGLTSAAVLMLWRLTLQGRGLVPKGGRPRNDARRQLVERLMADFPRKADGDLADGFWPTALDRVREAEGKRAPATTESLRLWWADQPGIPGR